MFLIKLLAWMVLIFLGGVCVKKSIQDYKAKKYYTIVFYILDVIGLAVCFVELIFVE